MHLGLKQTFFDQVVVQGSLNFSSEHLCCGENEACTFVDSARPHLLEYLLREINYASDWRDCLMGHILEKHEVGFHQLV